MTRRITRLQRWLFRMPILAFRLRLGWLFRSRLLLLTHTGRASGRPRRTVLEVPLQDGPDIYYVASGWGTRPDWYRNILADPRVQVTVGTRRFTTTAEVLSADASAELMVRYSKERPRLASALARAVGWSNGTPVDWYGLGHDGVPWVRLAAPPRT